MHHRGENLVNRNEETEPSSSAGSVSSQLYRPMLLRLVFVLDWFLGHIPSLLDERSLRQRAKNSSCFKVRATYITSHLFIPPAVRGSAQLVPHVKRQMRGYTHPGPGAGHTISG